MIVQLFLTGFVAFFCSDKTVTRSLCSCCFFETFNLRGRYDHTPKFEQPLRSQGYTGFPVVRSAEISFVRQIQLLMFSIYEERLNLEVSRIGLEEVCSRFLKMHLFSFVYVVMLSGLLQHL